MKKIRHWARLTYLSKGRGGPFEESVKYKLMTAICQECRAIYLSDRRFFLSCQTVNKGIPPELHQ